MTRYLHGVAWQQHCIIHRYSRFHGKIASPKCPYFEYKTITNGRSKDWNINDAISYSVYDPYQCIDAIHHGWNAFIGSDMLCFILKIRVFVRNSTIFDMKSTLTFEASFADCTMLFAHVCMSYGKVFAWYSMAAALYYT